MICQFGTLVDKVQSNVFQLAAMANACDVKRRQWSESVMEGAYNVVFENDMSMKRATEDDWIGFV